ncbi:MAG: heparinase II/III-family protein, partial [Armatimonadetes bacterium]|nr:heparinase II/III-family protein [Armatimonadota bacterium]
MNRNLTPLLGGVLMLALVGGAVAAPTTLYKPRQIAIARENLKQHPWAAAIVDGYRRSVAYAMGQDRAALRAIVPDLTPGSGYGQVCPACVGRKCAMGETGVLQWSISAPDKLVCKYCRTEYPNPQYPETGTLECPQMGQRFTYYVNDEQRAHPDEDLGKYAYKWAGRPVQVSFTGVIRAARVNWAAGQLLPLAKLYALTGDVAYAERTAWLLERFSEVFPHYLYHSYGGCFADCDPAEAAREMGRHPSAGKFPPGVICHPAALMRDRNKDGFGDLDAGFWGSGRLTPGAGGEGSVLLNAVVAYDLTRDAKRPDGQPVYPPALQEQIVKQFLVAGCGDMENYAAINNKAGPGRALSGAVGMLLQQPERVRRALAGFEALLGECFHFDGFCKESPSYSSMHLGLMEEIPNLLTGYSDPAGYTPEQGQPLQDFDPFTHLPRYRLALESMVRMLRPDLKFPVIGDTHSGSGASAHYIEVLAARYGAEYAGLLTALQGQPLEAAGSEYALWHRDPALATPAGEPLVGLRTEYFPGWQVGVLRAGLDDTKTALYFNGYCAHGHRHRDTLGLIYHAYNTELASDRGYMWDDPRNAWTGSTLAHNLVAVDETNQNAKDRHSRLELFGVTPGLEVMQASAVAYTQCPTYRRTVALVRLPEGGNYAVDCFRVAGGKRHHYACNANGEFLGAQGIELTPVEGKLSWLTNLRAGPAGGAFWQALWREKGVSFQLLMTGTVDRVLVTDAPGWRSARGDQLNAPPITEVLAERHAPQDLSSLYTAVMVPFRTAASPVRAVSRILPNAAGRDATADDAVAVVVDLGDRTDYIICAPDDQPREYGPVHLAGRFGYVSLGQDGKVRRAYLLDGTELTCGQTSLKQAAARLERKVVKVEGSTVTLDEALPAEGLVGRYVLSGETGFEIAAVQGPQLT